MKSVESKETFETEDTSITITEVTDIDLAGTGTRIGANMDNYSDLEEDLAELVMDRVFIFLTFKIKLNKMIYKI